MYLYINNFYKIIFYFIFIRKLLFYIISIILALTLYNNIFNILSLIDIAAIFNL
jgi:hypothetical protein